METYLDAYEYEGIKGHLTEAKHELDHMEEGLKAARKAYRSKCFFNYATNIFFAEH